MTKFYRSAFIAGATFLALGPAQADFAGNMAGLQAAQLSLQLARDRAYYLMNDRSSRQIQSRQDASGGSQHRR